MPRKTRVRERYAKGCFDASMRPRPDAAENSRRSPCPTQAACASMRPRPDAAENAVGRAFHSGNYRASMRPRPDAAENLPRLGKTPIKELTLQ